MPDWHNDIRRRLAPARLRPEREAEVADEVAQHLEDRYQTLLATGQSSAEAEQGAWRELENADVLGRRLAMIETAAPPNVADVEAMRWGGLARGLWHDLRYAIRSARKRPLLSATVVATLALSLGPTTAVLGMADMLFFKPLPGIAEQDRLLDYSFGTPVRGGLSPHFISYTNVAEISRGATTVAAIAGHQVLSYGLAVEGVAPRLALGGAVTANYFDVLGVHLTAGRVFRPEEDATAGGEPVIVLNEALARGFFDAPDAAIGRVVLVNAVPFTVVGVAPAPFRGTNAARPADFWIPGMSYRRANHFPQARWAYEPNAGPFYEFIVRMANGATLTQTTAELGARTHALAARDLGANNPFDTVEPILQPGFAAPASLRPTVVRAVQLIGGVAGLLVLLGIANVANLLIFGGLAAGRDVAIRKALGASATRLLQLRLVESLLLALLGAAGGVTVALILGRLVSDFRLPQGLGTIEVAIDWRVLTVLVGLAVVVGIASGLAPAVLAVRESVNGVLGRAVRTGLPRASRIRYALAAVQIALSLTLLVGALLFLATLRNLHAVDLGFDPTSVTLLNLNLRGYGYTNARALEYQRQLADVVRQQPGVEAVGLAYQPPLVGGSYSNRVYLSGQDATQSSDVAINGVSADYFRAIQLPMLRGRAFTTAEAFGDVSTDRIPVVLTDTLAHQLFGSMDVIGRELRFQGASTALYVIGVTRASHFSGVDSPPDAMLYEPLGPFPLLQNMYVLVRSTLGRTAAAGLVTAAATRLDATVPLAPETTFDALVDKQLSQQRLFAWMLGLLGTIGFVLAAVGLHGLVAQTVVERRREFGIRLAIGADRPRIIELVLRRAAVVTVVGLVVGLLLTWFAVGLVESRLYGVTAHDPRLYAAAALLMVLVVAVASASPVHTATGVDPIEVLRSE